MPNPNNHAGGHYALDVDGSPVESLKAVSGLDIGGDVVLQAPGPDLVRKKQIANIRWSPGKATIGIGMGKGMYEWMKKAFDHGASTSHGTLAVGDFNFRKRSVLTFTDALLTSVTVPRLDTASKDAGEFEIEFEPGDVRVDKGDGSDIGGVVGKKQQPWLSSDFRFQLGSLPCARVASIDAFTWTCTPTAGTLFQPDSVATVKVPNLRLSISAADYDAWAQAAHRWFIDGHHLDGDEMDGLITLLAPDLQAPLGAIALSSVGFLRFAQLPPPGGDTLTRFVVDLYVEKMSLRILRYEG